MSTQETDQPTDIKDLIRKVDQVAEELSMLDISDEPIPQGKLDLLASRLKGAVDPYRPPETVIIPAHTEARPMHDNNPTCCGEKMTPTGTIFVCSNCGTESGRP